MASRTPPAGVYVPAVIFFTEEDELDLEAISAHVLRLAKGGVTGILVQGSNGEAQHLSHSERASAIAHTRRTLDSNGFCHVGIVAGTGAQSTRESRELCEKARDAGAEWALVLTPSTWPPQMNRDAILRFHREVADKSPIPTLVYNFPVVTAGQNLDSDVLSALGEHPNIVGAKLSCGEIGKLQRVVSQHSLAKFSLFIGRSDVFLPSLLAGSAGGIMALVNLAPKAHVRLFNLWKQGKIDEAKKLQEIFVHADWSISKIGGISGLKAFVSGTYGYGSGRVRGPLGPAPPTILTADETKYLRQLVGIEAALPEWSATDVE